jgi:hypothetical protein
MVQEADLRMRNLGIILHLLGILIVFLDNMGYYVVFEDE